MNSVWPARPSRRLTGLAFGGILLLTLALRLYRFPEVPPPLHYDEASNWLDAQSILDGARPIFFPASAGREPMQMYLEAVAFRVMGTSDAAVRIPSVAAGLLTVALSFVLAREWLLWLALPLNRTRAAMFTAFLLSVLVWSIQENRIGYRANLLPVFSALALWLLLRALRLGRARDFLGAGLVIGAAQYTYLASRFLPLAAAAIVGVLIVTRTPRPSRLWRKLGMTAASAGLVAAPLAIYLVGNLSLATQRSNGAFLGNEPASAGLAHNLLAVAGMFLIQGDANWRNNVGNRPVFDPVAGLCFVIGLVAVVTLAVRARPHTPYVRGAALALLGWLAVMAMPSVLSEAAPNELREVGMLPALLLLPALGLELATGWAYRRAGTRGAAVLATLALALVTAISVQTYFFDYANRSEPYYAFDANYVDGAEALPSLLSGAPLLVDINLANMYPFAVHMSARDFRMFDSRRTWVLAAGVADYVVPATGALTAERLAQLERWTGARQTILDRYGLPVVSVFRQTADNPPPELTPVPARDGPLQIGETVRLSGYSLDPPADALVPGQPLAITLAWRVLKPGQLEDTFSFKLLDAQNNLWAQLDERAGAGEFDASLWRAGDFILDQFQLPLSAGLPPGHYHLDLSMYRVGAAQPMRVQGASAPDATSFRIAEIVAPAPAPDAASAFHPARPLNVLFDSGLRLSGYTNAATPVRPGATARLDLFWLAGGPVAGDAQLTTVFSDQQGRVLATQTAPLLQDYRPARWRAGDGFHTIVQLPVPPRAASGASQVRLQLTTAESTRETVVEGPPIVSRSRLLELPAGVPRLDVEFREGLRLSGFGIAPPGLGLREGQPVQVNLVWQAAVETETRFTVFVQLLDEKNQVVAQHDGPPAAGAAPTDSWIAGEYIPDRHSLTLPPTLPAGAYRLIAGLYDARTLERLPLSNGGDFVLLATLQAP